MKVGIYNEPSGTFGGSEYLVTVMAHALALRHQVEIVHHNRNLSLDLLRELSGLDLNGVRLRQVEREHHPDPSRPRGVRYMRSRYRAQREWHKGLSSPYDVFITSTHGVPPFCHAPRGILLTLFPVPDRRRVWPWSVPENGSARRHLRRLCFEWMWQRRFATYQQRLSISEYSRHWTRAWWKVRTRVLYPPVDTQFRDVPKSNLVLSVGRFSTRSHSKRQIETMAAFHRLKATALRSWCYYSVGGLEDDPGDRAYFDAVEQAAARCGAHAVPNIQRAELRDLYARAKVFWHAAGYGADAEASPFEAEHFGIATVEAMAAGAVPVVYDHGGQSEIVEHGRSGYLWTSLDELQDFTARLAADEGLRARMADAARARAATFSRDRFTAEIERIVG